MLGNSALPDGTKCELIRGLRGRRVWHSHCSFCKDRIDVIFSKEELAMQAQDVMTPNPATISPETSVAEAWDLMRQHAVRHMPVVDRGALVGMVSDRDLTPFDMARVLTAEGAEALRRELSTPVVKVMSADVVDVSADAELGEVVDLLVENRIGAVPVVRPETQELVGIVSYIDVLEAVRDLLEVSE